MPVALAERRGADHRWCKSVKRPIPQDDWSDEVRALHRHDLQEWWEPGLAPHVRRQYHNQLDRYLRFADSRDALDILDVGCAQGTLALLLAERGHRVVAVDLRPAFLEYARSRHERGDVEFLTANAMELNLGREFDLVFANQIIEHVVYPETLLARLVTHLKPGARLIVTTPNGLYALNSLPSYSQLGDPAAVEHRQFTADGDGHFFAYTLSELRSLAMTAGLEDVDVVPFETPIASGHMKARFVTGLIPLRWIITADRTASSLPWLAVRLCHQLLLTGWRR